MRLSRYRNDLLVITSMIINKKLGNYKLLLVLHHFFPLIYGSAQLIVLDKNVTKLCIPELLVFLLQILLLPYFVGNLCYFRIQSQIQELEGFQRTLLLRVHLLRAIQPCNFSLELENLGILQHSLDQVRLCLDQITVLELSPLIQQFYAPDASLPVLVVDLLDFPFPLQIGNTQWTDLRQQILGEGLVSGHDFANFATCQLVPGIMFWFVGLKIIKK